MLENTKDTIVKIKDSQNKDKSNVEYAENEVSNSFNHVTHRRNTPSRQNRKRKCNKNKNKYTKCKRRTRKI